MKMKYEITRYHTDDSHDTLHFATNNLKTARAELANVANKMRKAGLTVALTHMHAIGRYWSVTDGTWGIWYQINKVN